MYKIILLIIINSLISYSVLAQVGNLYSGQGAGDNENSSDNYTTIYGDSSLTDVEKYNSSFGTLIAKHDYLNDNNLLIGYKTAYQLHARELTVIGVAAGFGNAFTYSTFGSLLLGNNTGYSITSGYYLTLIGENAGYSSTNGDYSTFIGNSAGYSSVGEASDNNLFIGHNTGYHNISGEGNVAIGNATEDYGSGAAGYHLTTGGNNVLLGASVGSTLTTGEENTFIGTGAGGIVQIANENTFIGGLAGYNAYANSASDSANQNVYLGYKAGYTNQTGRRNAVIGYNADFSGTSFCRATAMGANSVIGGHGITLIGYSASANADYVIGMGNEIAISGSNSIGWGYQTTIASNGDYSISLGYQTTMDNDSSIGIGYQANIDNTEAIGIGSSVAISGDNAVALGANNSVSGANALALGYNVSISNDNQINIGNDAVMSISGIVNWTTTSDGRLKTSVKEDIPGLDFILKLRPVTYHLTTDFSEQTVGGKQQMADSLGTIRQSLALNRRYTGFIAQEVEQVAQSIDYDFSGVDHSFNGRYGLRYAQFTVPLVKATQEMHQQTKTTTSIHQKNEEQIEKIDALLEALNNNLDLLENK